MSKPLAIGDWPFDPPVREQRCADCGELTTKFVETFYDGKSVITCSVCENPRHSMLGGHGSGMFNDLVLDHVLDEHGKPVRVTSVRELRAAEKRYNFKHHAANFDEANWNKPPQQQSNQIADHVPWMYPEIAERMLKDPEIQADLAADRTRFLGKLA